MSAGKLWVLHDRFGNEIYLTEERWHHIIDADNHPEVEPFFDDIAETIRRGRRQQDPYDPNGYRYSLPIPDLPDGNNHLVVCVRFRWRTLPNGILHEEKFVTTTYFQFF